MDILKNYLFIDDKIWFAVFGALLGYSLKWFLNWVNNKQVYRDKYYSKLTDKQFNAYLLVEDILKILNLKNETNDKKLFNTFFKDLNSFECFLMKFNEMGVGNYLLGEKLTIEIHNMNILLLAIKNELLSIGDLKQNEQGYIIQYAVVGVKYHDKLNSYFLSIQKLLFDDYIAMHEIRKFMRKRSMQLSKIIKTTKIGI